MAFVVNGADWRFDGLAVQDVYARIDRFLTLVTEAKEAGDTVWIGDDFQYRHMLEDEDLWTLFARGGRLALDDQLLQELTAWLMQAPRYLDEEPWPDGAEETEVAIDVAAPAVNTDVAWAHHSVRAGERVGVLSLLNSGSIRTVTSRGECDVYFAIAPSDHQFFWRAILRQSPRGLELLQELATKAYPNIYFVERVISGANDLAGGYLPFRSDIQSCFEVLSDHGAWIFTGPPPTLTPGEPPGPDPNARPSAQIIADRFKGFAITAAPEHADVYDHRNCREPRQVVVGEETLYCEWHIKLEKHQNRIHIHGPTSGSGNRVIVAIVHRHLPLPGD